MGMFFLLLSGFLTAIYLKAIYPTCLKILSRYSPIVLHILLCNISLIHASNIDTDNSSHIIPKKHSKHLRKQTLSKQTDHKTSSQSPSKQENTPSSATSSKSNKKILIVYYSLSNNTQRSIQALAKHLKNHTDCIIDIEQINAPSLKTDFLSYIKAAFLSLWEADIEIDPIIYDPADYTDIILCFPIWMGAAALPIHSYLKLFNNIKARLYLCITHHGNNTHTIYETINHLEHKYHCIFEATLLIQSILIKQDAAEFQQSLSEFAHIILS